MNKKYYSLTLSFILTGLCIYAHEIDQKIQSESKTTSKPLNVIHIEWHPNTHEKLLACIKVGFYSINIWKTNIMDLLHNHFSEVISFTKVNAAMHEEFFQIFEILIAFYLCEDSEEAINICDVALKWINECRDNAEVWEKREEFVKKMRDIAARNIIPKSLSSIKAHKPLQEDVVNPPSGPIEAVDTSSENH